MSKLTVTEYALKVGLTREAIHYQIKQKKIKSKKIKGKFYILIDDKEEEKNSPKNAKISELENQVKLLKKELENDRNIIKAKEETIKAQTLTNISLMQNYKQLEEKQLLLEQEHQKKKSFISFFKFWEK